MTKINGVELIEVDTLPANGAQRAGCRTGVPTFAKFGAHLDDFLRSRGLGRRSVTGDFRTRTAAEMRERVVRIKRSALSRTRK